MTKYLKILFTLLVVSLSACRNESEGGKPKVAEQIQDRPEQIIVGANISFVDSNHTKAIMKADSGFTYSLTARTVLKQNIKVDFMSKESNTRISTLSADSLVIDDISKDMTAFGNVVVHSDSTFTTLTTQKLQWNNKDRKLFSTEFVKIISPNEVLQGYGFESDEKLSYYKIFNASGGQR